MVFVSLCLTDGDGHFTLEGIPEGFLWIESSARGFSAITLTLDIAAGEKPLVTFELEPARGVVEGIVLGVDGKPASGIDVELEGARLNRDVTTKKKRILSN